MISTKKDTSRSPSPKHNKAATLFVGSLEKDVTEEDVVQLFGEKNVVEISMALNSKTNECEGYCFIELASAEIATEAVKNLNGTEFHGKKILVEKAKKTDHKKKKPSQHGDRKHDKHDKAPANKEGRVFVGGLDPKVDEKVLRPLFEKFGKLTDLKIARDNESNESKGYAFVQFEKDEDSNNAVKALNATTVNGKKIGVEKSKAQAEKAHKGEKREAKKGDVNSPGLFVAQLSKDADNEDLEKLFSPYGKIVEIRVPTEKDSKEHKGFAFVTFETAEVANKALEALNESELKGKKIKIEKAAGNERKTGGKRSRSSSPKAGKTLYIGNLSKKVEEDALKKVIAEKGAWTIKGLRVVKDPKTKENMGFAFVDFATDDEASEALKALNGTEIQGSKVRIQKKKAK